ncbi:hypothetical protein EMPS_01865 [Entomortierella parvispora]|uniref:Uncharacterized protein n=1 Tax=Entomortierella parvispora TaxID=205924 RepID=A0A9P3LT27_9FUNG|nr:hypothetical protein EMPS_01865 [Entomortierella parvispora]
MFQHLSGLLGNPNIPVRLPNDDTSFNPQDYPNVVFHAQGKISGKIRLVHGGIETDDSGKGLVSTRIWIPRQGLEKEVTLQPVFDQQTLTITLETPPDWGINTRIYHETMIQYPASLTSTGSLSVQSPSTTFSAGVELARLLFGSLKGSFTNASVETKVLRADAIQIGTTNASIRGRFEAGHLNLTSTNGAIETQVKVREPWDGQQSTVRTRTTNSRIECTVSALETSRGLWMENTSSNGHLEIEALLTKADRASFIQNMTSNAKIHLNLDARNTTQPLEVKQGSSNGNITSSITLPPNQPFKGEASSSNSSVDVNLTEEFQGSFILDTSNSTATVEGTDLTFSTDKKSSKRGTRGHGPSEMKISTTNAHSTLRFYKATGAAATEKASDKEKEAKASVAQEDSTNAPPPYSSMPQNL